MTEPQRGSPSAPPAVTPAVSEPPALPPTFTPFSRLPPELRFNIWRLALPPRIVRYDPNGDPGPGVLRACFESRSATRPLMQRWSVTRRDGTELSYIRGPDDVFRIDECEGGVRGDWGIDQVLGIAALRCPSWSEEVRTLAMCVDVDSQYERQVTSHTHFWGTMALCFPRVGRLLIILGDVEGFVLGDLVEVKEADGAASFTLQRFNASLEEARGNPTFGGRLKDFKLAFMGFDKNRTQDFR